MMMYSSGTFKYAIFVFCCFANVACLHENEQANIPYSTGETAIHELTIPDRFHIFHDALFEHAEYVANFKSSGIPASFTESLSIEDDTFLFLVPEEDTLLWYKKGGTVKKVAGYGQGPGDIQHGIRLIKTLGHILLVQANRVSVVSFEDPHSGLNVLFNSDTFINSAGVLRDGRFVVDSFDGSTGPSLKVLDSSYEKVESHGEYFNHPNKSVLRSLSNFSFTQTADGRLLLRFGGFPFGGMYDDKLNLVRRIHIRSMFSPDARSLTEENMFDLSIPQSRMFAYKGAEPSEFWIAVNHNVLRQGETGMYSDDYEHFFDYFTLSLENGLEYKGSSQYSMFPAGDTMFISGEEYLYYLPYDLVIETDENEPKPFQIPDSFNL
ncbi:MAG: hypothetical protein LAT84_11770 [Balneolia bacterium]|nr:hypothetical protein [Balneolia bacterium]